MRKKSMEMTIEEKREFLKKYKYIDKSIERKVEELSRLRSMASRVTPLLSAEPKAKPQGNQIETIVEQIILLEDDINRDIDSLYALKSKIRRSISELDGVSKLIIELKYIDGLTWEQITDKLHYADVTGVKKRHRRILSKMSL